MLADLCSLLLMGKFVLPLPRSPEFSVALSGIHLLSKAAFAEC